MAEHKIRTSRNHPEEITGREFTHADFACGKAFPEKRTGRLPAMGWNSWNAFGSSNSEDLTKQMADRIRELELDRLGYRYVVLDDGCYRQERVDGKLANEPVKFPSGFRALADYLHERGLLFGMYNDIGTNLCAGAAVGTCGFEDVDAESYADWDIDFLKVDNCYYLWDNATFSAQENARYTYAPNLRGIRIQKPGFKALLEAAQGVLTGNGARITEGGYATEIGTYDGTNVGTTPVGERSGELRFAIEVPEDGTYDLSVIYATGARPGVGAWLQVAIGEEAAENRVYDALLPETGGEEDFAELRLSPVQLCKGANVIRLMNHRRQENTLQSYAAMFYALKAKSKREVLLSICEWGKTQPQNWGYKVGDSWRILNDITFAVGSDRGPGSARWIDPGTPSITSQYDKCVIMDEFAGPDRGWNDPDMMVIGMRGITETQARTHMNMWCMMNAPLMLGMDLRTVEKGDAIWRIIANESVIALNQDPLGIQAKRVYCSLTDAEPDLTYVTNHDRVDILAKPLADGAIALCFINLSEWEKRGDFSVSRGRILRMLGSKVVNAEDWEKAGSFLLRDLWTGETTRTESDIFRVEALAGCDSVLLRVEIET